MRSRRRRELLLSLGGLAAGGCSYTPTLQLAAQSLGVGQDPAAYPLSRAQVEASQYAQISARFGDLPRAIMVLSQYDGDARYWTSVNRAVLVTRHGRLIQTVGLARDLRRTRGPDDDPLSAGLHQLSGRAGPYRKYVDVAPADYDLPVEIEYQAEGREEIEILEHRHATVRVREKIRVAAWNWSADNSYWADSATGFIWKSEQRYCPELAPLEIEVLKPPV